MVLFFCDNERLKLIIELVGSKKKMLKKIVANITEYVITITSPSP